MLHTRSQGYGMEVLVLLSFMRRIQVFASFGILDANHYMACHGLSVGFVEFLGMA